MSTFTLPPPQITNEAFEILCRQYLQLCDIVVDIFLLSRPHALYLADDLRSEAAAKLIYTLRSCQRRNFVPDCWGRYLRASINYALIEYVQAEQLQTEISYPREPSEQSEYDHPQPIEHISPAAIEQSYLEHVLSICPDDNHRRLVTMSLANQSTRQIADEFGVCIKTILRMRKRLLTLLTATPEERETP